MRSLHGRQYSISIHALREEGDRQSLRCRHGSAYFYPRPPRGGRPSSRMSNKTRSQFLSTPSARRATNRGRIREPETRNFYPRPPRGGRRQNPAGQSQLDRFLSTPSARRATIHGPDRLRRHRISIHALREEGDISSWSSDLADIIFLSTPSARRATVRNSVSCLYGRDFYPRPPRGGRRGLHQRHHPEHRISIHALREEGDIAMGIDIIKNWRFLSTPSARRATWRNSTKRPACSNFYPRPPRGGRPAKRLLRMT